VTLLLELLERTRAEQPCTRPGRLRDYFKNRKSYSIVSCLHFRGLETLSSPPSIFMGIKDKGLSFMPHLAWDRGNKTASS
jgi:hypothetical protein